MPPVACTTWARDPRATGPTQRDRRQAARAAPVRFSRAPRRARASVEHCPCPPARPRRARPSACDRPRKGLRHSSIRTRPCAPTRSRPRCVAAGATCSDRPGDVGPVRRAFCNLRPPATTPSAPGRWGSASSQRRGRRDARTRCPWLERVAIWTSTCTSATARRTSSGHDERVLLCLFVPSRFIPRESPSVPWATSIVRCGPGSGSDAFRSAVTITGCGPREIRAAADLHLGWVDAHASDPLPIVTVRRSDYTWVTDAACVIAGQVLRWTHRLTLEGG